MREVRCFRFILRGVVNKRRRIGEDEEQEEIGMDEE
jgi:hypothetical protein